MAQDHEGHGIHALRSTRDGCLAALLRTHREGGSFLWRPRSGEDRALHIMSHAPSSPIEHTFEKVQRFLYKSDFVIRKASCMELRLGAVLLARPNHRAKEVGWKGLCNHICPDA